MNEFPAFLRNPMNRVDPEQQYSGPEPEGYVFDGMSGYPCSLGGYFSRRSLPRRTARMSVP